MDLTVGSRYHNVCTSLCFSEPGVAFLILRLFDAEPSRRQSRAFSQVYNTFHGYLHRKTLELCWYMASGKL